MALSENDVEIRQEITTDYTETASVIKLAFENAAYSDHREHLLVEKLRKSPSFIPQLSLVAVRDNTIIGHILLTKITIINDKSNVDSLALAPVSVRPEYQGKGIGSRLMLEAHRRAKDLGHSSIVLLGHADYYPKFGYKRASNFGIIIPFEAPDENCMAVELMPGALRNVSGTVQYDPCFFE